MVDEAAEGPSMIDLRDNELGLRATVKRGIVEAAGVEICADGAGLLVAKHDVLSCIDPECLACAVLLCPDDDHRHLRGCPWGGCARHGPHVLALTAARRWARTYEAPIEAPLATEIVGAVEAMAHVFAAWTYLQGLAAGAYTAGAAPLPGLEVATGALRQAAILLVGTDPFRSDAAERTAEGPTADADAVAPTPEGPTAETVAAAAAAIPSGDALAERCCDRTDTHVEGMDCRGSTR